MINVQNVALLSLVKGELESTIQQVEERLEIFADDREDQSHIDFCIKTFHQVKGVCQLVGLPAAVLLASEQEKVAKLIVARKDAGVDEVLTVLCSATTMLVRYLSYVYITQKPLPELLIPAINELRVLRGSKIIADSEFFKANIKGSLAKITVPVGEPENISQQSISAYSKRLRHMYQVGLLAVIEAKDPSTGFKMMTRAIERIGKLTAASQSAAFWRLTAGVIASFRAGDVSITRERKILLGQIDRQIKQQLVLAEDELENIPESLVKSCVYILTLADKSQPLISELRKCLSISPQSNSDKTIRAELRYMTGPDGSVINAVVTALKEELKQIEEWIDLAVRGKSVEAYESLEQQLTKVSQTLFMIGLPNISEQVRSQVEKLGKLSPDDATILTFEYETVADMLVKIDNAATSLMTSGAKTEEIDCSDVMSNENVSLSLLEEVNNLVVIESRAGLTLAKRAISSYIDSEWDRMHLDNVPTTLNSIWGALVFLQMDRAASILSACQSYIEDKLLAKEAPEEGEQTMETLADAISSVDYYLESLEENKPIGDGILDVAEESMDELGMPVKAA